MREIDRLLAAAGRLIESRAASPETMRELAAYADDPAGFCRDVLGLRLWERQVDVMRLPLAHRYATVVAAHNLGKSFSLAALTLWWTYARQGAVVTIAPIDAQLKSLWRDVRTSWFEARVPLPGELLEMGLRVSDSPPVWAISRTTTSGLRLKGLHSRRPLLVIVDEADAIDATGEDVWSAALTLGGGEADRLLAAGNPTGEYGTWFNRCSDPTWGHVQLSALDHPNVIEGREALPTKVSREWVRQIETLYGAGSPEYRRQVLGEFADDVTETLVRREWLDLSYRLHDASAIRGGAPLRVGVDPSMGGRDRFAVAVADGGHVAELASWVEPDTAVSTSRLVEILLRHGVAREGGGGREALVYIDVAFGGKVIHDLLRQEGWPVVAYWSNGAPDISDELRRAAKFAPELWHDVEPWANRRAQAFCTLARLLGEGRCALPRDPRLAEELLAMHRRRDARGMVLIEGKGEIRSRLGRSPDLADAVSMAVGTVEPADASCTVGGTADITF